MFFIPLNQIESVELVVHALRVAGGEADCSSCPAVRVCMKQCLAIAGVIEEMIRQGNLPSLDPPVEKDGEGVKDAGAAVKSSKPGDHLKIIK